MTPVALIVCNTIGHATIPDSPLGHLLLLIGHPFIALSIAVLMAFLLLGRARGLSAADIQKLSDRSLKPGGQIILVTGLCELASRNSHSRLTLAIA